MNQRNQPCCEKGHKVGIVSANVQQLANIYPVQTAILRGTLYPELDKPMKCASDPTGRAAPNAGRMTAFAAWEVRLYLNTHPNDANALQLYHQLCKQAAKPNYACAFVPFNGTRWNWLDDPWPWECEANVGRK